MTSQKTAAKETICWLDEFSCVSVEWTSRSRRFALRLQAITGGLGKVFFQLAVN